MKSITWIARVLALAILAFGLPFYFGYGNPLPFAKPYYSLWENVALMLVPVMFIGLALGWKYPKTGGWLAVGSVATIFIVGFLTDANLSINLLAPIVPGVLYVISGYTRTA